MPFLQRVTGERMTGTAVLVGHDRDLVDQVGMLRPAGGNRIRDIPDSLSAPVGQFSSKQAVAAIPHVREAQRLFGEPDYLRRVITADFTRLQELYDERLATLPASNASAPPSS